MSWILLQSLPVLSVLPLFGFSFSLHLYIWTATIFTSTAVQETLESYRWPPPHWSWWLLHFSAFRPQFSLAQQTMPFCLNAFISESGHRNITRISTRSHLCKIIPQTSISHHEGNAVSSVFYAFFSWELWLCLGWLCPHKRVLSCQLWV